MKIELIKLFINENEKSQKVAEEISHKLKKAGFTITDKNDFDLGIAVGGDGAFLRMILDSHFRENALYVGVNAGTLGFAQDIEIHEIDSFIEDLKESNYFYEEIGIQTIQVETGENTKEFHCLNEIVVREKNLKTLHADILIDDVILENYVGDGVLISTSFGSTAYNLCFGGSMVYNEFDTLQITPIAPVSNKSYPTLQNSLILPADKKITIIPNNHQILITVDGRTTAYSDVFKIHTTICSHIRLIRKSNYNYIKKINDKYIK